MHWCIWDSGSSASHRCLGLSCLYHYEYMVWIWQLPFSCWSTSNNLNDEVLHWIDCTPQISMSSVFSTLETWHPKISPILWCPPKTRYYRGVEHICKFLSSCCDLGLQKGSLPPGTWNTPSLRILTQLEAGSLSIRSPLPGCSPVERISRRPLNQKHSGMEPGQILGFELYQGKMMKSIEPRGPLNSDHVNMVI